MSRYCIEPPTAKFAKARVANCRASYKNTHEVCRAIQGSDVADAQAYLEAVLEHKRCIPFRKYKGGVGRTAQVKEFSGDVTQGRWPEKSVKAVLEILANAIANAEFKNLDTGSLYIYSAVVQQAAKGRRRTYRAHGRINPWRSHPCHVNIILMEREDAVPLPKTEEGEDKRVAVKISNRRLAALGLRVGGPRKQT